jgi:hypothetical protein
MSTENTENVTMSVNEQLSEVETTEVAANATEVAANATEVAANATEVAATTPVNLTVGGLANVRRLLELAVERGAFKANEMTAVGRVYDEFVGGLNTLSAQIQATQPTVAEETVTEPKTATEPKTV